jgi:hypothetical protein
MDTEDSNHGMLSAFLVLFLLKNHRSGAFSVNSLSLGLILLLVVYFRFGTYQAMMFWYRCLIVVSDYLMMMTSVNFIFILF